MNLLPQFSYCLADTLNARSSLSLAMPLYSYVQWEVHGCKHPLLSWRAEAAWAPAIRDCKDLAWALTQEWALSIHGAKTSIVDSISKYGDYFKTYFLLSLVRLTPCVPSHM